MNEDKQKIAMQEGTYVVHNVIELLVLNSTIMVVVAYVLPCHAPLAAGVVIVLTTTRSTSTRRRSPKTKRLIRLIPVVSSSIVAASSSKRMRTIVLHLYIEIKGEYKVRMMKNNKK